jgi:uncharacterized phage protein (TIGR01671 family)
MREIEFRGRRKKDGKWAKGHLTHHADYYSSIRPLYMMVEYEVDTETVGQYTGLKDSNGVKIFEGDIVDFMFFYQAETEIEEHYKGVIEFDKYSFAFKVSETARWYLSELTFDSQSDIEIIGNIHDSPELLDRGGQNE